MANKWLDEIHYRISQSLFVLLLMLCSFASHGETGPSVCDDANHVGWSEVEKWVLGKVCWGNDSTIDLNDYGNNSTTRFEMTKRPDESLERHYIERQLSSAFLNDLLQNKTPEENVQNSGITIKNAFFKEPIRLDHAQINFPLRLENSLFNSPVDLNYIEVKDTLSFNHSVFREALNINVATITGDLFLINTYLTDVSLRNTNIRNSLDLCGAKGTDDTGNLTMDSIAVGDDIIMYGITGVNDIGLEAANINGSLDITNATVNNHLDMDSIKIGGNLSLIKSNKHPENLNCKLNNIDDYQAVFNKIDLPGAKINGWVNFRGAKVTGRLNMDGIVIQEDLFMRNASFEETVDLSGAAIGDQASMFCSTFSKVLRMDSINIGSHLYMNGKEIIRESEAKSNNPTTCDQDQVMYSDISLKNSVIGHDMEMKDIIVKNGLDMSFVQINGSLILTGSIFNTANLQYIQIEEKLDINDSRMASLMLHNANVNTVHLPNWTGITDTDISGFRYQRIENSINEEWHNEVIAGFRNISFAPQPYEQLAVTLNDMAYKNKANGIRIAKLDHKYEHTDDFMTKLKLFISKFFIGYGYGYLLGYFNSLAFVLVFILSGILFLRHERRKTTNKDDKSGYLDDFFYSLDSLLPIITLNKKHEEVQHKIQSVRYYFYFHKIMGYMLALIIVAGLSGVLTPTGL